MLANRFLYWVDKVYNWLVVIGSNLQSLFLLYMRVTWGHQLLLAGISKLQNIAATVEIFTKLGIPSPLFHAYEVGLIEAISGPLLVLGLASRLAALPVFGVMLVALTTAHVEAFKGLTFFINPYQLVIQQPYPILITAVLVFLFGPGRISLDAWLKRWVGQQPKY